MGATDPAGVALGVLTVRQEQEATQGATATLQEAMGSRVQAGSGPGRQTLGAAMGPRGEGTTLLLLSWAAALVAGAAVAAEAAAAISRAAPSSGLLPRGHSNAARP